MFLCYISESFLFSFIKWLVFFHFILVFQRKKLYPDYIKKKKVKDKMPTWYGNNTEVFKQMPVC